MNDPNRAPAPAASRLRRAERMFLIIDSISRRILRTTSSEQWLQDNRFPLARWHFLVRIEIRRATVTFAPPSFSTISAICFPCSGPFIPHSGVGDNVRTNFGAGQSRLDRAPKNEGGRRCKFSPKNPRAKSWASRLDVTEVFPSRRIPTERAFDADLLRQDIGWPSAGFHNIEPFSLDHCFLLMHLSQVFYSNPKTPPPLQYPHRHRHPKEPLPMLTARRFPPVRSEHAT